MLVYKTVIDYPRVHCGPVRLTACMDANLSAIPTLSPTDNEGAW